MEETKEEIKNHLLEEYSKKYKPEDLTLDGIPNIETQLREINILDDEDMIKTLKHNDFLYKREMTQRVKCLSLIKMGKNMMTNTQNLNNRDKKMLENIMHTYNDIPHDIIIKDFNEIACQHLFDDTLDYTNYPIYNYTNFLK